MEAAIGGGEVCVVAADGGSRWRRHMEAAVLGSGGKDPVAGGKGSSRRLGAEAAGRCVVCVAAAACVNDDGGVAVWVWVALVTWLG